VISITARRSMDTHKHVQRRGIAYGNFIKPSGFRPGFDIIAGQLARENKKNGVVV
jgi:hypothetical protein